MLALQSVVALLELGVVFSELDRMVLREPREADEAERRGRVHGGALAPRLAALAQRRIFGAQPVALGRGRRAGERAREAEVEQEPPDGGREVRAEVLWDELWVDVGCEGALGR